LVQDIFCVRGGDGGGWLVKFQILTQFWVLC